MSEQRKITKEDDSEILGYIKTAFLMTWLVCGYPKGQQGLEMTKQKMMVILSHLHFVDVEKWIGEK